MRLHVSFLRHENLSIGITTRKTTSHKCKNNTDCIVLYTKNKTIKIIVLFLELWIQLCNYPAPTEFKENIFLITTAIVFPWKMACQRVVFIINPFLILKTLCNNEKEVYSTIMQYKWKTFHGKKRSTIFTKRPVNNFLHSLPNQNGDRYNKSMYCYLDEKVYIYSVFI